MNPVTSHHVPVQRIAIAFVVVIILGVVIAIIAAIYRVKTKQSQPVSVPVLTESQKVQYIQELNIRASSAPVITQTEKAEYLKSLNTNK